MPSMLPNPTNTPVISPEATELPTQNGIVRQDSQMSSKSATSLAELPAQVLGPQNSALVVSLRRQKTRSTAAISLKKPRLELPPDELDHAQLKGALAERLVPIPRQASRAKLITLYTKHVLKDNIAPPATTLCLTPAEQITMESLNFSSAGQPSFVGGNTSGKQFHYSLATVSQLKAELLRYGIQTKAKALKAQLIHTYKVEVLKMSSDEASQGLNTPMQISNSHQEPSAMKESVDQTNSFDVEEIMNFTPTRVSQGVINNVIETKMVAPKQKSKYSRFKVTELRKMLKPFPCVVRGLLKDKLLELCEEHQPEILNHDVSPYARPILQLEGKDKAASVASVSPLPELGTTGLNADHTQINKEITPDANPHVQNESYDKGTSLSYVAQKQIVAGSVLHVDRGKIDGKKVPDTGYKANMVCSVNFPPKVVECVSPVDGGQIMENNTPDPSPLFQNEGCDKANTVFRVDSPPKVVESVLLVDGSQIVRNHKITPLPISTPPRPAVTSSTLGPNLSASNNLDILKFNLDVKESHGKEKDRCTKDWLCDSSDDGEDAHALEVPKSSSPNASGRTSFSLSLRRDMDPIQKVDANFESDTTQLPQSKEYTLKSPPVPRGGTIQRTQDVLFDEKLQGQSPLARKGSALNDMTQKSDVDGTTQICKETVTKQQTSIDSEAPRAVVLSTEDELAHLPVLGNTKKMSSLGPSGESQDSSKQTLGEVETLSTTDLLEVPLSHHINPKSSKDKSLLDVDQANENTLDIMNDTDQQMMLNQPIVSQSCLSVLLGVGIAQDELESVPPSVGIGEVSKPADIGTNTSTDQNTGRYTDHCDRTLNTCTLPPALSSNLKDGLRDEPEVEPGGVDLQSKQVETYSPAGFEVLVDCAQVVAADLSVKNRKELERVEDHGKRLSSSMGRSESYSQSEADVEANNEAERSSPVESDVGYEFNDNPTFVLDCGAASNLEVSDIGINLDGPDDGTDLEQPVDHAADDGGNDLIEVRSGNRLETPEVAASGTLKDPQAGCTQTETAKIGCQSESAREIVGLLESLRLGQLLLQDQLVSQAANVNEGIERMDGSSREQFTLLDIKVSDMNERLRQNALDMEQVMESVENLRLDRENLAVDSPERKKTQSRASSKSPVVPRGSRLPGVIRFHCSMLLGITKTQTDFPAPATPEEKGKWLQELEEEIESDNELSGEESEGPEDTSGFQHSKIVRRFLLKHGVMRFAPDFSQSTNSAENKFLWDLAVKLLVRLVECGEYKGVCLNETPVETISFHLRKHVKDSLKRKFRMQKNWTEADLEAHAKAARKAARIATLREIRRETAMMVPDLEGFVEFVNACCSDDESVDEEETSESPPNNTFRKRLTCHVLQLPWRSLEVERLMVSLDARKLVHDQSSPSKPTGPLGRTRKRLTNNNHSKLAAPPGLPIDFYDTRWLSALTPLELSSLEIDINPGLNEFLATLK